MKKKQRIYITILEKTQTHIFSFLLHKSGFPSNPSLSLFHWLRPSLIRNCKMAVRTEGRIHPGVLIDLPCVAVFLCLTFLLLHTDHYPPVLAPISFLDGHHYVDSTTVLLWSQLSVSILLEAPAPYSFSSTTPPLRSAVLFTPSG